ncbi:helix-turn-helix domain-containing protein [Streptomyces sp. NPDC059037]|uniref:helix-turn-helix domain-containing protein n=1 Tax=Streptomyces sp. NPDC059037 TaxID=3346710 RepID=UPI0036C8195A
MPNQYGNPVTDKDREAVRRLHAQGLGRNAIAREIGRATRTVSVLAAEMHLTFDTTLTEDATRSRIAQLAEKRAILADALTDDALRLTEQLWAPAVVFSFGGKDNTYAERHVAEPPAHDKKALMSAAATAAAQSLRLVPPTDDSGAEDARSMLGKLFQGLAEVVKEGEAEQREEAEGESP